MDNCTAPDPASSCDNPACISCQNLNALYTAPKPQVELLVNRTNNKPILHMEGQEIKYCIVKTCGVPEHLHNTCCGWVNANLVINPQTPLEEGWRDKWIEANPNVYAPTI